MCRSTLCLLYEALDGQRMIKNTPIGYAEDVEALVPSALLNRRKEDMAYWYGDDYSRFQRGFGKKPTVRTKYL